MVPFLILGGAGLVVFLMFRSGGPPGVTSGGASPPLLPGNTRFQPPSTHPPAVAAPTQGSAGSDSESRSGGGHF